MGQLWEDGGYSSDVSIRLVCGEAVYDVAQIGPESLILRNCEKLPTGHARIVMWVDGNETSLDVILGGVGETAGELTYA
jgi:hypothetical protein